MGAIYHALFTSHAVELRVHHHTFTIESQALVLKVGHHTCNTELQVHEAHCGESMDRNHEGRVSTETTADTFQPVL